MLSKVCKNFFSTGANVWVNKHTKVICQGITGNQVSQISSRDPFRHSKLLIIIPKWLEVSIPRKQEPLTSAFPSLRIAIKPRNRLDVMLPSSTFLLPEQLVQL